MISSDFDPQGMPQDAPGDGQQPILIFYDTEFTDLAHDADLLSIGLVAADNADELYIEIADAKAWSCSEFVKSEVIPFFGRHNPEILTRDQAAVRIESWLDQQRGGNRQRQIHLVADSFWDWRLLIGLYTHPPGPSSWARKCNVIGRFLLSVLPHPETDENGGDRFAAATESYLRTTGERHHALVDARAMKAGWHAAMNIERAKPKAKQ